MFVISNYIWAFDLSMDDSGIVVFSQQGNPVHITSIKTNDKQSHGKRLKYIADKVLELKEKSLVAEVNKNPSGKDYLKKDWNSASFNRRYF